VSCALRDGVGLLCDVFRPDDGDTHPALLLRTPYDKTYYPFQWMTADPTKLALAGYAVVIQDVRGRFASAGEYPGIHVAEAEDGYDTIQWVAAQPWCDGRVGMYGASYMGGVQWKAASMRPPALRAIAPATSQHDVLDQHMRRGGAIHLGLIAAWHMISIGPNALTRQLRNDPSLPGELSGLIDDIDRIDEWVRQVPLLPFPPVDERGGGLARWFGELMADERTPLHDRMTTRDAHTGITVPALEIAGWHDVLLQPELDNFVAMRTRSGSEDARRLSKLVVGPWAHAAFPGVVGEIDYGLRASGFLMDLREDLTGLHRRWFDARLKEISNGIDDEPPVKLFVMGRNRWRWEEEWPLARARVERWYAHASGALSSRAPDQSEPSVFTLDPADPVPTRGGTLLMHPKYVRGPVEQSPTEARPDVLVFTSSPLEKDLEVTGRVHLHAWVAAETVDTDVVGRLCDVWPDGRSYNVVDGIQRLRFREGLTNPKPLTPGEPVEVSIDLWSTSHVFEAGHRLRLHVCGSDFPRYDRCPGSGESSTVAMRVLPQRNRLFHDPQRPTFLEIPVIHS
jgi:uncharacterized protein